jgi:hypothetical protein
LRLCEKKRIRRAQGEKKEKKGAQSRQAAKSAAAEGRQAGILGFKGVVALLLL